MNSQSTVANLGLIVNEDVERAEVFHRQNGHGNATPVFLIMAERLSQASWFSVIRRFFQYEDEHLMLNHLSSVSWICLEASVAVSQIVAALMILGISQKERPALRLRLWVIGYALCACFTLPFLCWRYRHPYVGSHASPHSTTENPANNSTRSAQNSDGNSRVAFLMERCKMSLNLFFAVWFIMGNVWVFETRIPLTEDAPMLYRMCMAFLALSCIGYALPFILFIVLCCFMPRISSVFAENVRAIAKPKRGATSADIAALPTHIFMTVCPQNSLNDEEGSEYTQHVEERKKRRVSADITECCICLSNYRDGESVKELPCLHLFHAHCVDEWLLINSSCPLCKKELNGSKAMAYEIEDISRRVIIDMSRFSIP